ncbi:MAG: type II toxin-antitoxin system RelE/ParE family toxin [Cyclobacteriaceae bacterium]
MAKVIFRQKAIDDLNNIWDYTFENWSENQADKYYAAIKLTCKAIGENLDVGKVYSGVSQNLRGIKCEKHIIFYHQVADGNIEIIRILHERMDLKNRLIE